MKVLHLTKKDFKTSLWSGGSTTELFILPVGANYATREFSLRISSAKVDLQESDFTTLNNVVRYITPLTSGFTLSHPNSEPIVMKPLATPYRFSGDIPTHCVGQATDFNLMLKGVDGKMDICDKVWQLKVGFNCLYAICNTTINLESGYDLKKGELLVVFATKECEVTIDKTAIVCFANI